MIAKIKIAASILLLVTTTGYGQAGSWETIVGSPETFKHDDIHFTENMYGIAVGFESVYMSDDGGDSWRLVYEDGTERFRAVAMLDDTTAIVGSLDANRLLRTTDGGKSWSFVHAVGFSSGVCGLFKVNSNTVYGVGRYTGGARFIKSVDKGETWTIGNLSDHLTGAIDLHFWDENNGVVIGRTDRSSRIIKTSDGGDTWRTVYDSGRRDEWGWKLTFPSDSVGYASIQQAVNVPVDKEYILRTHDGGDSWVERAFWAPKRFGDQPYSAQGIGFVTDKIGWIGSYNGYPTLVTENAGLRWREAEWGKHVNRLRFLGDSLAFASGERLYKSTSPLTLVSNEIEQPDKAQISSYPNPAVDFFRIEYTSVHIPALVFIDLFDQLGRKVRSFDAEANGSPLTVPVSGLAPGRYLVQISEGEKISRMLVTKVAR